MLFGEHAVATGDGRPVAGAVARAVLAVLVLTPGGAYAQGAALSGTVTDATGLILPGVAVAARSSAPQSPVETAVTDVAGQFTISALRPGTYDVTFRLSGFRTVVRTGVALSAGATATIAVEMTVQLQERVVVVGTRAQPRSITESTVPVDVITTEDFARQGETDLANQLRTVIPSFNVNTQPISDASTIVRPAMLRNLAPDHTLVLLNGKRRHRSSVIDWHGGNGVAFGSQGPDISAIPSIALRQVEVLRDGAAAQYGSDAIAGVMNFQLKDARSGGSVEVSTGAFSTGWDGDAYTVAGNVGLPLGATGFANLSLEYGHSGRTDRSIQRGDVAELIAAGNTAVREWTQVWGSPEIDDDLKVIGNFGHLFGNSLQLYGHTSYASKMVTGGFFFRNPNTRGGVFSADGGQTLLIGDALLALSEGSANCPTVVITENVPDSNALARVLDDPNCFSFQERFPGGFTPSFGGDATDVSVVGGLRRLSADGVNWDASVSVGAHEVDLFIENTVNASLGLEAPTGFNLGSNRQREVALNVDVSYPVNTRVNVAAGAEWRDERYATRTGQRESWDAGPYAAQGFSAGANGFTGYSPRAAGIWSRSNIATYGDIEFSGLAAQWTFGAAGRLEYFEDFGHTANGKLSGRYRVTDLFALRGSLGSGFRAPTPGQQNGFNVSTIFDPVLMDLTERGTIPAISPVAQLRGGKQLQPETSVNYAGGVVINNGSFTLTADYFRIDVANRLAVTQDFTLTSAEVDQLLEGGVENARGLASFQFFTNDISTTTQGIDLVSTYAPPALGGDTVFSAVFNHTSTTVTRFNPALLNVPRRIRELQEALPRNRWTVNVTHRAGVVDVLGRVSYYGAWFDWDSAQTLFGGKPVVDFELGIPLSAGTMVALGSQNVFNTFPDESPNATSVGERYSEYTPWGFNGAYYYARIQYSWGN